MPDGHQPSIEGDGHQPSSGNDGHQPSAKGDAAASPGLADGAAPTSHRALEGTQPARSGAALVDAAADDLSASPSLLSRLLPWRRQPATTGLGGVLTGEGSSALSPAERAMLERIVAFDTKRVDDVAIPRADIVGADEAADLQELLRTFSEAGHSRLPVYRGDLDDPVGMVHIKDVVGLLADPDKGEPGTIVTDGKSPNLVGAITRRVLYVPPSMPITDLLLRMQAQRVHMALVIDEFGGTDGLVTIEDLIEEIVGDIRDEHDDDADLVLRKTSAGRLDADARLELDDIEQRTGLDLKLAEEEADTIGGLVVSLAGRVPVRGEVIRHPLGYEFEIAEADPRRIRRVFIRTKRRRRPAERPVGEGATADGIEAEREGPSAS